jgi:hypothetical protein
MLLPVMNPCLQECLQCVLSGNGIKTRKRGYREKHLSLLLTIYAKKPALISAGFFIFIGARVEQQCSRYPSHKSKNAIITSSYLTLSNFNQTPVVE